MIRAEQDGLSIDPATTPVRVEVVAEGLQAGI
jgi:hypothetical protein